MYYKGSSSFGVREVGGRQVCAVTRKGASVDALRQIAEGACRRLEEGIQVENVKAWIAGSVASL